MTTGVRCMMMRGGSSKGAYFLADDLPADTEDRDRLLLSRDLATIRTNVEIDSEPASLQMTEPVIASG